MSHQNNRLIRKLSRAEINLRKAALFALFDLRGHALRTYCERFLREDRDGIPPDHG
jgi:hypothetical protein